mgnify:CR=1
MHVLFQELEEQFNVPSELVHIGHIQSRYIEHIGDQVHLFARCLYFANDQPEWDIHGLPEIGRHAVDEQVFSYFDRIVFLALWDGKSKGLARFKCRTVLQPANEADVIQRQFFEMLFTRKPPVEHQNIVLLETRF